jgi:hypothetical protein
MNLNSCETIGSDCSAYPVKPPKMGVHSWLLYCQSFINNFQLTFEDGEAGFGQFQGRFYPVISIIRNIDVILVPTDSEKRAVTILIFEDPISAALACEDLQSAFAHSAPLTNTRQSRKLRQ